MLDTNWVSFESKVKITFSSGVVYEATGKDKIVQVDLNKELSNNNTNPLGIVSSNTIGLKLLDRDKKFIKNNVKSPYYGLLNEGFKIEYYIKLDNGEFIRSGVFYATDIKNSANEGSFETVTVNGADIIQYIGNTPIKMKGVKRNISVKTYIEELFRSVGLSDSQFNVSNTLNKVLKFGYNFGDKLKDVLNNIAQSYMCNIFVDDNGIIQVIDLLDLASGTNIQFEFDGVVNTFRVALGTSLLDTYNAVKVDYNNPTSLSSTMLLEVNDLEIPVGTSELGELTFGDNKATNIDYISLLGSTKDDKVVINNFNATQNSIIISVTNSGTGVAKVNLKVYGGSIKENTVTVEKWVAGIDVDKRKYLNIEAKLIQNDTYANEYGEVLLRYLSSENNFIDLSTKGNPLLKLGDLVNVKSSLLEYDGTCILSGISLSLGSSYTANLKVLSCESLLSN